MNCLRLIPMLSTTLVALTFACAASESAAPTTPSAGATPGTPTEPAPPETSAAQPEPSATADTPSSDASASGGPAETRTLAIITKLIKDSQQPVLDCYEQARKQQPGLTGTVTVHFMLDADGGVKSAEINAERTSLQSPEVAECAVKLVRSLKYPPSSRGMESECNHPFKFKP